jgi:hypothetical protein
VRHVEPANGATGVPADAPIRVVFSYRVDRESVRADSFRVSGTESGVVAGSFAFDDSQRTVTFQPSERFAPGEEVVIVLSSELRSTAGTPLRRTSFRFRVFDPDPRPGDGDPGDPPDDPPPLTVLGRTPRPFASAASPDQVIEVELSDFLNPFLVGSRSVAVCGETSGPVPVRIESPIATGRTLRIVPQRRYAPGERVGVDVRAGLESLAGGVFLGDTFHFRVRAEPPLGPSRNLVSVSAAGRVKVLETFDLDRDGRAEVVIVAENSGRVEVLRYDDETRRFDALASFDFGEVVLSLGAADADADGDLDLLAGLDDSVAVLVNVPRNPGPGLELWRGPEGLTRSGVRRIAAADLDHAGGIDLVLDTDTGIQVLLGGVAARTAQVLGDSRLARTALLVADINADGHQDIVYGTANDRRVACHLGSSSGALAPARSLAVDGDVEQVDVDDFDGDGMAEILALLLVDAEFPASPFRLLEQDPATGELVSSGEATASATTLESAHFARGDLDGDGGVDLVLALARDGRVVVFDDPAAADPFPSSAPAELAAVPEPSEVRLADLDGDQSLDVAIASGNELRISLSSGGAVEPPPPPQPEPTFELRAASVRVRQGDAAMRALLTLSNSIPADGLVAVVRFDPRVVDNPWFDPTGTVLDGAEFASWSVLAEDHAISYVALLEFFPPFEGRRIPAGAGQELLRLVFDVPLDAPLGESPLEFPAAAGDPPVHNAVYVGADEHLPAVFAGSVVVDSAPPPPPPETPDRLRVGSVAAAPGTTVRVPVFATSERAIEAFTAVVAYPRGVVSVVALSLEGSDAGDLAPELVFPADVPESGYFAFTLLFDFVPPFDLRSLPPGDGQVLFYAELRVAQGATPGDYTLALTDGLGDPPLNNLFSSGGQSYFPALEHGTLTILDTVGPVFLRGDANRDARVDAADAVFLLNWIFEAGPAPPCMDAADVNDDGRVNITDGTWILDFVLGSAARRPAPPYPEPGPDPTEDGLDCAAPLAG